MELIIPILIAIPLGLIPAYIAKNKGHSFGLWWFYGWALFIVAIIHVQFIEDYNAQISKSTQPTYAPVQPQQPIIYPSSTPNVTNNTNQNNIEELKGIKELLDSGIITQEEFDIKKKQLLNL